MSLSKKALEALRSHWAVSAIDEADLRRAEDLTQKRLAKQAVGGQITFSVTTSKDETALLRRVSLAYELAAIEGLDELSRRTGENTALYEQAIAASFHTFESRRLLPVPLERIDRLFFVLKLSAVACCGNRMSDLRHWYSVNKRALEVPSEAKALWDHRLLYRLFECWIRLFRQRDWEDLDQIRDIIAGMREDQHRFEEDRLRSDSPAESRAIAIRLVALYHWAKCTEVLATYMLQGRPANPFSLIEKHFNWAIRAATASGDMQHEITLRWLHAAAHIMVTNSLSRIARTTPRHP